MKKKQEQMWLSPKQVAELLGVHVATVRRWCDEERLPHAHLTKRLIRIPRSALPDDGLEGATLERGGS